MQIDRTGRSKTVSHAAIRRAPAHVTGLTRINADAPPLPHRPAGNNRGDGMSTGGALYLILAVSAVIVFGGVLAYYSWQQSRFDRQRAAQAAQASQPAAKTGYAAAD